MVTTRSQQNLQVTPRNRQKNQQVASNSEKNIVKVWDSQFKEVRAQIVGAMKPLLDQHRTLCALEIQRFRSCISALPFLPHPICLIKAKEMFALVGDICAYGRSTTSAPSPSLVVLEIFIKEFLAHPTLRRLLDPSKKLIPEASGAPLIQELILGHLCLSFPKQICLNFTDSFCHSMVMSTALNDGKNSELGLGLGLDSTLVLLNTSFNYPMPYLLQAHLAISASRCIEAQNPIQVLGLGFEQAISAFELSAKLYWRSLCNLDLGQRSRPYLSRGAKKPPLYHAPDCHMDEMMLLFKPTRSGEVSHKDLYLWISSYIDEIQQVVHGSTRLQTGDALKGIVSMLLADKVLGKTQVAGIKNSEELVSLASLARLMASSLFRVVAEARTMIGHAESHGRRGNDLGLERQVMSSLELDSNGGCRLVGRKADHLVSKILLDAISGGFSIRKRSVMMLQHFAKLMLVGLRAHADFLWKACILVLSAIMNLMVFEGEDFDALKMLAGDAHEREETPNGSDRKRKCKAKQLDASVLPNSKRMHLADEDLAHGEGSCQSNDVCDRPVFNISAEVRPNLSDDMVNLIEHPPDDLADFLDCSPDMDLPFWLKEREGLFKKRQAAQKKKKKMLMRLLGVCENAL